MCPIGSPPLADGAAPVLRSQRTAAFGLKPATGPLITLRVRWRPRVSYHVYAGPTGVPFASTGTVEDHIPVHAIATTSSLAAWRTRSRVTAHQWSASCVAAPSGPKSVMSSAAPLHAIAPVVTSTRPTLMPVVPWSTAITAGTSALRSTIDLLSVH